MSSPKSATTRISSAKARAGAPAKVAPAKVAASKPAVAPATAADGRSIEAIRLAADIERALGGGQVNVLNAQAMQALMAAACKVYAAHVEKGGEAAALSARTTVMPTEVMVTASGLLKSANLAVFELGMWQSWTGR